MSQQGIISSVTKAVNVTPSDVDLLPFTSRCLYVGDPGNIRVLTQDGDDVTIKSSGHQQFQIAVTKVFATGTTAGSIVAGR